MSQNYIITIGVGQYQNKEIDPLSPCCENDCSGLVAALEEYGFESLDLRFFSEKANPSEQELECHKAHLVNQEATRGNIIRLFEKLTEHDAFKVTQEDPDQPPKERNNLVIYYSGHGQMAKAFGNLDFFHWVPFDYDLKLSDVPKANKLYSISANLFPQLGQIRFRHLILITDACFSGGSLNFANFFLQGSQINGYDPAEEGSVWGVCSSASNKLSYGSEKNGVFTGVMIELLKKNTEDELLAEELFLLLGKVEKLKSQRTFHERLGLMEHNTGNFSFKCTDARRIKNAQYAILDTLQDGIPKYLNFSNEKDKLKNLDTALDCIVVFSNNKDSGLPLMMRSALNDPLFPGYEKTWKFVDEKTINHSRDLAEKMYNFFDLSLDIRAQDEDKLIRKISLKLESKDRYIGILLNGKNKNNENFLFIEELIRLVKKTHEYRKPTNHLYLFVLDEMMTDYSLLPPVNNASVNYMLITDKIAVKATDVNTWFGLQLQAVKKDHPKRAYVQDFLRKKVYNEIADTFSEDHPAAVIQIICNKAMCPELASVLLNQIDDKPINYGEDE